MMTGSVIHAGGSAAIKKSMNEFESSKIFNLEFWLSSNAWFPMLRLSKKEVNQLKAADEDDERDPSPSNPSLQSPPPPPPPPTDTSKHNGKAKSSGATPSKFERKNSFLSKFFGNSGSAVYLFGSSRNGETRNLLFGRVASQKPDIVGRAHRPWL